MRVLLPILAAALAACSQPQPPAPEAAAPAPTAAKGGTDPATGVMSPSAPADLILKAKAAAATANRADRAEEKAAAQGSQEQ